MWCCPSCGTIARGAACPSCGRLRGERIDTPPGRATSAGPYADISRKISRVRLRGDGTARWSRRGLLVGGATGTLLGLFITEVGLFHAARPGAGREVLEVLIPSVVGTVGLALFLAMLFAALAGLVGGLIRPVFLALFSSPERFEREYGPVRDTSGGRAPGAAIRFGPVVGVLLWLFVFLIRLAWHLLMSQRAPFALAAAEADGFSGLRRRAPR